MANRPLPSPALVVAVLALVAALAGTAVAGSDARSSLSKQKVKTIATKQINKLAPGLSVEHADTAASATKAADATHADTATSANNATSADSALNAANAANADKVDEADVCSGVQSFANNDVKIVCSSGPLQIQVSCGINAGSTTMTVALVTTQSDAWLFGAATDGTTGTELGDALLSIGEEDLTSATDTNASAAAAAGGGAWITAGHANGGSINGQFSVRANRTGTDQGTCRLSMGAIAR